MTVGVVKVPSFSKPGEWHSVIGTEQRSCDCIRFDMSPRAAKSCRHTELVAKADDLLASCAKQHGSTDDRLCRQCLVALLAASAWKVRRRFVPKPPKKPKGAKQR